MSGLMDEFFNLTDVQIGFTGMFFHPYDEKAKAQHV